VANKDHAFVLCGYRRDKKDPNSPDWITFYRQDDQRGPYLTVDDVFNDTHPPTSFVYSPWEALMIPLPQKLWLPPEPVEFKAGQLLLNALPTALTGNTPGVANVVQLLAEKHLALRTYAVSSNAFKAAVKGRIPSELVVQYRTARFPRYIWVVEAIDRLLRVRSEPCVIGEAVFDATSSEISPTCLALHLAGYAWIRHSDGSTHTTTCSIDPYNSGGIGPP
jgi:hypothetical protein